MVIKHVGVWSAARMSAAVNAAIGLLIGLIFAAVASLGMGFAAAADNSGAPAFVGMLFGIGGIIVAPIFYGVMGLIGGALGAVIYNLVAGAVGGIEIDVQ